MTGKPLTPTEKRLLRDLVEERAAIIEEGQGCQRVTAEHAAAQCHGFASYAEYWRATR